MNDMLTGNLPAVPLSDQISTVAREIALRRKAYPRWIAAGRMKQATADEEIRRMEAALCSKRTYMIRDMAGPGGTYRDATTGRLTAVGQAMLRGWGCAWGSTDIGAGSRARHLPARRQAGASPQ